MVRTNDVMETLDKLHQGICDCGVAPLSSWENSLRQRFVHKSKYISHACVMWMFGSARNLHAPTAPVLHSNEHCNLVRVGEPIYSLLRAVPARNWIQASLSWAIATAQAAGWYDEEEEAAKALYWEDKSDCFPEVEQESGDVVQMGTDDLLGLHGKQQFVGGKGPLLLLAVESLSHRIDAQRCGRCVRRFYGAQTDLLPWLAACPASLPDGTSCAWQARS